MDWTMIGAVGEVLGALGVITTLGYLAVQVRHAKIATERQVLSDLLTQNSGFLAQLAADEPTVALWGRGLRGDETLSTEELTRFRYLLYQLVILWERLYYARLEQESERWVFEHANNAQHLVCGAPGFRSWLEAQGHLLSAEYRQHLSAVTDRAVEDYVPMALATGLGEATNGST